MKKSIHAPVALMLAVLIAGCSTTPTTTNLLAQARTDYYTAQQNPNVIMYAQFELKDAGATLERANTAANHDESAETVDQLAYLAKQKIALTQETARQKSAEAEVAGAAKQRDQIRLSQRTHEADQAIISAQQSNATAQAALGEAADAQHKTQEAQAHAAQLEAQLADLAAKKTDRGMVITLGDVLFGTDLARLNADGMRTAQKLASVLQENPQRTVLIEGFTDSTGTGSHNQELSERRASAVRTALEELGVSGERVATRGYGQTYPIAANDTAQNRQLNRRVEIVLSDANGKVTPR
ncbi:MAG: OmpA family protein [Burkholderiaceae bacterium]|nr:OmpA family protein [Burkholderiaceae bacterium]